MLVLEGIEIDVYKEIKFCPIQDGRLGSINSFDSG